MEITNFIAKLEIMLEIRGHARGGQGMVTAFEILAKVFSSLGDYYVQSFPAFGVERTGAPIQAFIRVAKKEIQNRSNVYNPHLIVVFDETLFDQVPVFDGLRENGTLLVNTEKDISGHVPDGVNVYKVSATKISLDLGLGSKSLPIVNAAMMGAIMRLLDADIEITKEIVKKNVPSKPDANAKSAEIAYNNVIGLDGNEKFLLENLNNVDDDTEMKYKTEDLEYDEKILDGFDFPVWSDPLDVNKTGNWRVLTPEYVTKEPPCSNNCPAGTDVRGFVKLAGEGKFEEAFELIYKHNPFPSVCGRVCPHFCEQNCNRNDFGGAINIGSIERFVGDQVMGKKIEKAEIKYDEKIAVVGSGPAGLTAALRLVEKGYDVTVFEAFPQAGGMMRTGIPKFRLPDDVLDDEIDKIVRKGVKLILNKKVSVEELEPDFDAVITAVGSHVGYSMKVNNPDLVEEGIDFLRNFKLNGQNDGIKKGDEIAIIGGGNTAIDVARTVLRLGAVPTIYYRRTENEMPAIHIEVEEALAEGVEIKFLTNLTNIQKNDNGKLQLEMIKYKLGEADESGRKSPVPIQGSEYTLIADKVFAAIGQTYDRHVFSGENVNAKQGKISFDAKIPLFSAGDMAWGGTITEAIGSGNKVAEEVEAYLQNQPYNHEEHLSEVVLPDDLNEVYYLPTPRIDNEIYHAKDFYNDFTEVVKSLTPDQIVGEGLRCLSCGECFSCGNCFNFCPDAAISYDEEGRLRINYDYCKGCGICVEECPSSALDFKLIVKN